MEFKGRHFWVASSILAMWTAVGVAAVSGGEFEHVSGAGQTVTEIPVAWGVAFFAAVGTVVAAFVGFRE